MVAHTNLPNMPLRHYHITVWKTTAGGSKAKGQRRCEEVHMSEKTRNE